MNTYLLIIVCIYLTSQVLLGYIATHHGLNREMGYIFGLINRSWWEKVVTPPKVIIRFFSRIDTTNANLIFNLNILISTWFGYKCACGEVVSGTG